MRKEFFNELRDKDVTILTADLGHGLFDGFKNVINVGIAEQNMIGIAAGMAMMGKKVYCYSIISFLIMRAFDQIKVDIDQQNLPVVLVGVGIDDEYEKEGVTHWGYGDTELISILENFHIYEPDSIEKAMDIARDSLACPFPLYIRLRKNQ